MTPRDDRIARLEATLPGWCVTQMRSQLARLDGLSGVMDGLADAYLRRVEARGVAMFDRPAQAALLDDDSDPVLGCSTFCGGSSGPVGVWHDGKRRWQVGTCTVCGQELAVLIAAA